MSQGASSAEDPPGSSDPDAHLHRADQRFHALLDAIQDYAIYLLDPDGHVATWNAGAKRAKGYEAAEIVGKHFSAFFLPEDVAAGKPTRILATAREKGRYEEEGWRKRKDGSRFWANVVVTPLRTPDGKVEGYAKVTRDLTDKRRAQETERELIREQTARAVAEASEVELRASEARVQELNRRLDSILEGVADGITVQDAAGQIIYANSAAAVLSGYASVESMLAADSSDRFERFTIQGEDGQPLSFDALPGRRVLDGAPSASLTMHVRDKLTGKDWWALIRSSAVRDEGGAPRLAINVWHDVTAERRQAQATKYLADATAALASSLDQDQMLSTLAQLLVPGLADWCSIHLLEDGGLRNVAVAHVNPARVAMAREIEKRYPPDLSGPRGLGNVLRTGASELYADLAPESLEHGAVDAEHLRILRSLGMRSVVLAPIRIRDRITGTLSLIAAESGSHYDDSDVALVEELGRRAGVALENASLYEEARRAVRRAEEASRVKDEFLATVSHELRTPLNAILGWSTMLRDPAGGMFAQAVDVIQRNARAQAKIIDDILDVSRIVSGKLRLELRPSDLVTILHEAIEVVRPAAVAKGLTLSLEGPKEPAILVVDPERIQQVAWNLLSNAVKFSEKGGHVDVTLLRDGATFVVEVRDTGRGIEPSFLPYVFDRFRQADSSTTRRVGGLGLGLAIVRHIVELHGGSVSAESEGLARGSTFSFALPIRAVSADTSASTDGAPRSSHPSPVPRVSLAGLRVLVVDDEEDARDLLGAVLSTAGAVVRTSSSAVAALDLMADFRPHVLVSDVGMPEVDGYELAQRLRDLAREKGGGIPSVALTAYTRGEDRTRALASGFTTHLGKPVDPEDLVSVVANLARFSPKE